MTRVTILAIPNTVVHESYGPHPCRPRVSADENRWGVLVSGPQDGGGERLNGNGHRNHQNNHRNNH